MNIEAYVFAADLLCPECVCDFARMWTDVEGDPEVMLNAAAVVLGVDRADESSFDSGVFPKVVFGVDLGGDDVCGGCGLHFCDGF